MIRYRDEHVSVRISDAGLRRLANDNALLAASSKRNERLNGVVCWVAALCLGLLMGYAAAQTAGVVS